MPINSLSRIDNEVQPIQAPKKPHQMVGETLSVISTAVC